MMDAVCMVPIVVRRRCVLGAWNSLMGISSALSGDITEDAMLETSDGLRIILSDGLLSFMGGWHGIVFG